MAVDMGSANWSSRLWLHCIGCHSDSAKLWVELTLAIIDLFSSVLQGASAGDSGVVLRGPVFQRLSLRLL